MSRTKGRNNLGYKTTNEIAKEQGNTWFDHYFLYLQSLAFQLFEWEGLPPSIDPRYLELTLHSFGHCAFYWDKRLGFIAVEGAPSGQIDHYRLPTVFNANAVNYHKTFPLYNYRDDKRKNMGVCIYNNDLWLPTLPDLRLFAQDLTELKEIIRINQNAQKTPWIIPMDDDTALSMKNLYSNIEASSAAIMVNKKMDLTQVKPWNVTAPYVVDKLNIQKNAVWNEVCTYLGINNANVDKRERINSEETKANDHQVVSSANIFLKSRKEACAKINDLYSEFNLHVDVHLRDDIVDQFLKNSESMTVGDQ